jgi:tetratricopeptide (TPR) repeat protein
MRRLLAILMAAALSACAARSGSLQPPAPQLKADELVRQGCYACLLEARAVYDAVPTSARRALLVPMLEVELLIALREKELALDPAEAMKRATAIAATLGPSINAARYIAIVDAVASDPVGTPRRARQTTALLAGREGLETAFGAIDASPFTPLFRQYLAEAVQCGRPPLDPQRQPIPEPGDTPLLLYRAAICDNPIDGAALEQVRAAVPRFDEAALFLGRASMAGFFTDDGSRARGYFEEAYKRFPQSPAVTHHLATVWQAAGDCRRGEAFFGETLALRSDHEDSRLGRAVCRTYLGNTDGALEDATVLIDGDAYNRAEAYYWRAWNRRTRKEIDLARTDIDASRALLYNARVLTLAGMIEHDQQQFDKAKEDLSRAREMDNRECQARWYLGLVGYATEQWPDSAGGFADAAECYARLIAETEAKRDVMAKRADVSEEFRSRQLAGFTAAIAEDSTQRSAADLNAAINYARAGDVPKATTYMKRAWEDPERRATVEDLRQVLGVPRW